MQNRWDSRKDAVIKRLPTLILIYCILQPILDVIGYWQMMLKFGNTFTMLIRMLLLAGSVLLGFLLSERRRYYYITAAVLLVLTGMHVVANLPGGYTEPITDLVNLVRIYLMPMTVLCFITFLRRGGDKAFRALKTGMLINILIIVLVELVSVITGTDRETYRHEHIGVLGWFFWANSQSAILAMMAPIVICWSLSRWKDKLLPVALFTVAAEVALYFFGTRLTFGAMVATGLGVGVCLLLMDRSRWRQAAVIFLVTALFTCALPLSPMARRMQAVEDINERGAEKISEQNITPLPDDQIPTETVDPGNPHQHPSGPGVPHYSDEDWAKMERIYHSYLYGMLQRFGFERVAAKYNYTLDSAILGNWRTEKLYFCDLLMEDEPALCRFFGANLMDMRVFMVSGVRNEETGFWEDGYINFDVENDFHGVYYLLGAVGLVLMTVFLLYFGVLALYRVIRDFKTYFTVDLIGFAGAYLFGLMHAYFTVSVLRRNNASVYMALVLAGLWYLSRSKRDGSEKQSQKA